MMLLLLLMLMVSLSWQHHAGTFRDDASTFQPNKRPVHSSLRARKRDHFTRDVVCALGDARGATFPVAREERERKRQREREMTDTRKVIHAINRHYSGEAGCTLM